MRIRLNKIDRFIVALDGKIKHLVLFDYVLLDKICDKIKCLISKNSSITKNINRNFGKIRIDLYNSVPVKILTFHNFVILIKPIVNKNKNKCHYNKFLEKYSNKHKSNKQYFK